MVAGGLVTFTLTVDNAGPSCATDVTVVDELTDGQNPVGLTALTVEAPNYTCDAGVCERTASLLDSDPADVITIVARVPADTAAGTYTNTAAVVWDSGSASDVAGYDVETEAVVTVWKDDVWDPVIVGGLGLDTVVYILSVQNEGPSDAYGVTVDDIFPAGVTLSEEIIVDASWSGAPQACAGFPCVLGDMPDGGTAELYVVAEVDATVTGCGAEETIVNEALVSWTDSDGLEGSSWQAETAVLCEADLDLKKRGPVAATVGLPYTYVLTFTNTGPSPILTGLLTLEDDIAAGLVYVAGSAVTSCDLGGVLGEVPGSDVAFTNLTPIADGETCRVEIPVTPEESLCPSGFVFNEAQVHALGSMDQAVWVTGIDCATGLEIRKEFLYGGLIAGRAAAFRVVMTNTADVTAYGVELTDQIRRPHPRGARIVDMQITDSSFGYVPLGGECIDAGFCNLPDLPPGSGSR